jgi:glutamine synthetase
LLPSSLMDAIDALDGSQLFRAEFGEAFVSHYVGMKRHEIGRFLSHVTDWEHREYFEAY